MGFRPNTEEGECEQGMRQQLQADQTKMIDFSTFKIIYKNEFLILLQPAVRSV